MRRQIRERAISCKMRSLNFNEIRQNAWRFKGDKGDFTQLQESCVSDGGHLQCTGRIHQMGRMGRRCVQGRPCQARA
jgi:hypothetical protein